MARGNEDLRGNEYIDSRDVIARHEDLKSTLESEHEEYLKEAFEEKASYDGGFSVEEDSAGSGQWIYYRTDDGKPDEVGETYDSEGEAWKAACEDNGLDTGTICEDFDDWVDEIADDPTHLYQDEAEEFKAIKELIDEASGYGDWDSGETLIRDDEFRDYAEQLADDIGAINAEQNWPLNHIDWEAAADELKTDYIEVDFDGTTYLMRA